MHERYGPFAAVVTSVRPGITGLWQVSGRNDIDYETRVLMGAQYVRQRTLLTDILILLRTVPAVLKWRTLGGILNQNDGITCTRCRRAVSTQPGAQSPSENAHLELLNFRSIS